MAKNEYRKFFAECKPMVKLNYFSKQCGIASSRLSLFMKGEEYNYTLSEKKLQTLYNCIIEGLKTIA